MILKILKTAFSIFIFALVVWFILSWIDVLNNNIGNGSHFQAWNLFQIAFGKFL